MGCSLDGSPASVFKSLGEMAKKAKAQIEGDLAKAGEPLGKSVKANVKKAETAMAELRAKLSGQDLMSPATRSIKTFGDDAKARFDETKRRFKELTREVEKGARDIERAEKQAARGAERESAARARSAGRIAGRVGSSIARGALNLGTRVAGDLASGAGVEMDLSSVVRKNVSLESKAVALSNAGYMETGTGANARRQDPEALIQQAREVALATATDTNEALDGLTAFVAKTGDLAMGRAIFKDMAVLAKATGTGLDDAVDAAGDVSSVLGEMPDKAAAIQQVMRAVAGGGKLGAVEMRDLATQMAKVAASANLFEGNAADNIRKFAALAQEARAHGGASSATQAATGVSSFIATFTKGARLKEFKNFGVSTMGAGNKIRDPNEIILDAIVASASAKNGGLARMNLNMGKMFAERGARRETLGFESAYVSAGGGDAGVAAVREAMRKQEAATLSAAEETQSFTTAMGTTESKVQNFNTQMEEIARSSQKELLPALQALAPAFLAGAKEINRIIMNLTGHTPIDQGGKDAFTAETGAQNALGASNPITNALTAGVVKNADGTYSAPGPMAAPEGVLGGDVDAQAEIQKQIAATKARIAETRKHLPTRLGGTGNDVGDAFGIGLVTQQGRADNLKQDEQTLARLEEKNDKLTDAISTMKDAFLSGRLVPQEVIVKNMPGTFPKVTNQGRQNPSDTSLTSHE